MTDEEKQMRTPAWKFELNLNSIITVVGFLAGFVAWGMTWADMRNKAETNSLAVERMDKRLTAVEATMQILPQHELRLGNVEVRAADAANSIKAVESTLSILTTDVRVVREILTRLEAAQNKRDG